MQDAEFRKKLLATFSLEAAEHIRTLGSGLIELQGARTEEARSAITERVFRAAHSLKGAARAVGLTEIERLCQRAEDQFSALQRAEHALSKEVLDELHATVDALEALLSAPTATGRPGEQAPSSPAREGAPSVATVRIATARLDALLYRAEELLSAKLDASRYAAELKAATKAAAAAPMRQRLAALAVAAEQHSRSLGAMVDALLEDIKSALMLPASSMLEVFPRLARDLAQDQGKEVRLVVTGADIEIDRRILDEMRDPLTHLVRNCVDHGIEAPEERRRKGKPEPGSIRIELRRQGEGTIEIVVSDDGRGIDAARLAQVALARGVATRDEIEGKPADELLPLVFRSGLSTSPLVTELSGRGLGLAIVREKVERLGGSVAVAAQPDRGTTFRMSLPLTLATFRGVHVRAGDRRFVLPTNSVQRVLRVRRQEVKSVANRPNLQWEGRMTPLVALTDALGLPGTPREPSPDLLYVLIVQAAERRIGLVVDEVLEEGEVLVKPLRKPLVRVANVAGATVLGSGEAVPILDVAELVASAAVAAPAALQEGRQASAKRLAALVAEDSITSRALLKAILESAGYEVSTAVDGVEALAMLKSRHFDIVVSDVEMPRMDGFELTARIRADSALSNVPVVLVTALDSTAEREKGIDVGASAYIVKSSFDQSNLLEVMRQLA